MKTIMTVANTEANVKLVALLAHYGEKEGLKVVSEVANGEFLVIEVAKRIEKARK
ncbi:MAG: hypothetical protein ACRC0J_12175 [Shewanella oncorhynchi]